MNEQQTREMLINKFKTDNVDTSYPGFYNESSFIANETRDPRYLNQYAFWVRYQNYNEKYLNKVKNLVPKVVAILNEELINDGRKGACVDMTLGLLKIFEKHKIWCVGLGGSLVSEYQAHEIDPGYYWNYDYEALIKHGEPIPGHAWLFCPPYKIIDLTIKYQPYFEGEEAFLPDYILQEEGEFFNFSLRTFFQKIIYFI